MSTAFEVLSSDHEEVKRLLSELELGPTAASGADSDQLALRKKMVQQLVIEQSKHEVVEEMFFWPTVREYLADGEDLANQAANQEQQAKVGGSMLAAAAVVGLGGWLAMVAAAIAGLAGALPVWASALIVGVALAVAAGALVALGRSRLARSVPPLPVTTDSVRRELGELTGRNGQQ